MVFLPYCKSQVFTDKTFPDSGSQECKAINGKKCVFPFKYKGTTYSQCTAYDSVNKKPWCATKIYSNTGVVINNEWEDCNDGCPIEQPGAIKGNNTLTSRTGFCTCSDITVTIPGKQGKVGGCLTLDRTGKYFALVRKGKNEACCESMNAKFNNYCINYSLCDCENYPETCCPEIGNSKRTSFSED